MNRQRFARNIIKMENEWLADLVQLARKDPRAEEKVNLIVKVDLMECEDR